MAQERDLLEDHLQVVFHSLCHDCVFFFFRTPFLHYLYLCRVLLPPPPRCFSSLHRRALCVESRKEQERGYDRSERREPSSHCYSHLWFSAFGSQGSLEWRTVLPRTVYLLLHSSPSFHPTKKVPPPPGSQESVPYSLLHPTREPAGSEAALVQCFVVPLLFSAVRDRTAPSPSCPYHPTAVMHPTVMIDDDSPSYHYGEHADD